MGMAALMRYRRILTEGGHTVLFKTFGNNGQPRSSVHCQLADSLIMYKSKNAFTNAANLAGRKIRTICYQYQTTTTLFSSSMASGEQKSGNDHCRPQHNLIPKRQLLTHHALLPEHPLSARRPCYSSRPSSAASDRSGALAGYQRNDCGPDTDPGHPAPSWSALRAWL